MILASALCCHAYYCNEHKMITKEISQVSKACKNNVLAKLSNRAVSSVADVDKRV